MTWHHIVLNLGVGFVVIACVGIVVWVIVKEWRDTTRRVEIISAFLNLRHWADKNGYTILFREQVWYSPFVKSGRAQLVFRVVVQDKKRERRWAWVHCGSRLDVKWMDPESWIASSSVASSSNDNSRWDHEMVQT
jgi:hypothetical protein